jgi:TIR domain
LDVIDRSVEARVHRKPDVFLSHSARDKEFVWSLAEDLAFCEVDSWLDQWELRPGESLHDVIGSALAASRFVAIVISANFSDSRWASDEMKQALARERRENTTVVVPIVAADASLPPFLEDKLYIDLRKDYYAGVVRLAALVHNIPSQHIEDAIRTIGPADVAGCVTTLRYAGVEPYVVMSKEDADVILQSGGQQHGDHKVRFSPEKVASNPMASPRLRGMMRRLRSEVWLASRTGRSTDRPISRGPKV